MSRRATTRFLFGLCAIVAVVAVVISYVRLKEKYDRDRLDRINEEWQTTFDQKLARERLLGSKSPSMQESIQDPSGVASRQRGIQLTLESDPEWRRVRDRLHELDSEREKILKSHPDWD